MEGYTLLCTEELVLIRGDFKFEIQTKFGISSHFLKHGCDGSIGEKELMLDIIE